MKVKFRLLYCISFFSLLLILSCQQNKNGKVSASAIAEGKVLASQYCQSCHLLPDPNWVDAKTWENGVLPAMGPRFGIFDYKGKRYPSSKYDFSLPSGFYPSQPTLKEEQ